MLIRARAGDPLERADLFISARLGITRSQAGRLIRLGLVLIGERKPKPGSSLRPGDEVSVEMPEETSNELVPEDIPLEILHEDPHLVVVNKPSGLVVYPAAGHSSGTMMNALRARLGELKAIGAPLRPGVVHRLDKDTSGVMVVALTDVAYYSLVEQFRERSTERSYLALVLGVPKGGEGVVETPIGRAKHDRKKMSTRTRMGKEARTKWSVKMEFPGASLIEAKLDTGRTHQIRVHMASIGHPVLGDSIYGKRMRIEYKGSVLRFSRQMLHADTLGFEHPESGRRMSFHAQMPDDMQRAINALSSL